MIDRLFTLILTLFVLIGGTVVIGAEWLGAGQDRAAESRIATLPRVEITGKLQPVTTTIAGTEPGGNAPGATRFTR